MSLNERQIALIAAEAIRRGCAETVTGAQEENNQAHFVERLAAQLRDRGVATPALDALGLTQQQVQARAAATKEAVAAAGTAQTPEQIEAMKRAHGLSR